MPGILTFKPIQANLTHNTSQFMGMDPYCMITVDQNHVSSDVCPKGGIHPHWQDTITLSVNQDSKCFIEVKDKTHILQDANVGICEVDLKEIVSQGRVLKWYQLNFADQPAGEILIEASYQPENPAHLVHAGIEKQAGMGILGMVSPTKEQAEQVRVEDPTGIIGVVVPKNTESKTSQNISSKSQNKGMEIEPQPPKETSVNFTEKVNPSLRKRSNDLDIPLDREKQTRPNYENEIWGKKDEQKKDIFLHEPSESLTRTTSEQPSAFVRDTYHLDKDKFHCGHKELEGLDLTSDIGPHRTGYDHNLWNLPQNLKELQTKSHPPK